ncbi:MAG TPA: porin [Chthoniobacterales bacterium]|jgi:phosphate-selective porin OprO and OprP|nr:porin [Chthoniobacterales bacterium]
MFIKKFVLQAAVSSLAAIILLPAPSLRAQTPSESERLQKLERAVEQLQKRNAELEQEVSGLKKQTALAAEVGAKMKTKVIYDGKSYVEKAVVEEEKPPVYVVPRGSEFKLVLGGYIQANFEDGDVSAFEGRFGMTALKDRFRLRRARINLTGDFAENFDFKIEGDFENSDGISSGRTAFEATDIFVNWHQFPEAQIKVGQWKAPFGLEQLTPDQYLIIIERSLPTGAITPERQIGVQVWGKPFTNVWPDEKDLLTYYAGIFNGNGRNTTTNDNNNFMYVGRLELLPFKGKIFGQDSSLKLGGDVLNSRDDKGTNISQTLNLLVNADGSLSPFVLPGAAERTAWSVDAWFNLGPFDLIGEYLEEYVNGRTVNGVAPGFADFTTSGYYIQGSYFLIPKKLQAAVRWEDLNPGQMGSDGIHSITGGLNYYIHGDDIKLMVNYIHTWSDFRAAHPEFGDDQFDEVIARVQLMF